MLVKNMQLLVRTDVKEKAMIERAASTEGLSVSAYLRRLALNDVKAKEFSLK